MQFKISLNLLIIQNINPVWYGAVHSVCTDTDDLFDKDTPSHADGPGGARLAPRVVSHVTWTQRTRDPPPAAETESARARLGTFLQSRHTSQVTFRHNVTMSRT